MGTGHVWLSTPSQTGSLWAGPSWGQLAVTCQPTTAMLAATRPGLIQATQLTNRRARDTNMCHTHAGRGGATPCPLSSPRAWPTQQEASRGSSRGQSPGVGSRYFPLILVSVGYRDTAQAESEKQAPPPPTLLKAPSLKATSCTAQVPPHSEGPPCIPSPSSTCSHVVAFPQACPAGLQVGAGQACVGAEHTASLLVMGADAGLGSQPRSRPQGALNMPPHLRPHGVFQGPPGAQP